MTGWRRGESCREAKTGRRGARGIGLAIMTGKRSSRAQMAALALLGLVMASGGALAQSAVNRLPGVIDRPTPQVNLPPLPRPLPPLVGAPTPQTVPDANALFRPSPRWISAAIRSN